MTKIQGEMAFSTGELGEIGTERLRVPISGLDVGPPLTRDEVTRRIMPVVGPAPGRRQGDIPCVTVARCRLTKLMGHYRV